MIFCHIFLHLSYIQVSHVSLDKVHSLWNQLYIIQLQHIISFKYPVKCALGKEETQIKEGSAKILIIDDDIALHRVFTRILQKEGYTVETAETGSQALEKIQNNIFDVALIDVKLPNINGLDLLPMLQKIAPAMVKIVITGYSLSEGRTGALQLGADEYFKKPIPPPELLKAIKEKLDGRNNNTK
jgi:CheY-like chemotaxis protein